MYFTSITCSNMYNLSLQLKRSIPGGHWYPFLKLISDSTHPSVTAAAIAVFNPRWRKEIKSNSLPYGQQYTYPPETTSLLLTTGRRTWRWSGMKLHTMSIPCSLHVHSMYMEWYETPPKTMLKPHTHTLSNVLFFTKVYLLQSIFGINQSLGLTEPTSQSIKLPDTTSQYIGLLKNICHS